MRRLFRYINKKFTMGGMKNYILGYMLIGTPIALGIVWAISYFATDDAFDFYDVIRQFIINLICILPIIANYIIEKIKFKKYYKKLNKETYKFKSLYTYDYFIKGEEYEIFGESIIRTSKNVFFVVDEFGATVELSKHSNKFEIVDIKESRKKKIKKLNRKLFI